VRSVKLIYLFDDNGSCSSFFVGTKNKEYFYILFFINFLSKRQIERISTEPKFLNRRKWKILNRH
jgi:hypothetical protein